MKTTYHKVISPFLSLFFLSGILLFLGTENVAIRDLCQPETTGFRIFWELRLPRLLFGLGLGGLLASVGGAYQLVFRNSLCEPYILGISSAVLLGMVLGDLFFPGVEFQTLRFLISVGFALALTLSLVFYSSFRQAKSEKIVLFGVAANFVLSSFLFLFLSFQNQSVGGGTLKWFFGFLPWPKLGQSFGMLSVALLTLGFLLLFSRQMEALTLGDTVARTLGVSSSKSRNWILFGTSVAISFSVLRSGTIGFVGLVVPQFCRIFLRPKSQRILMLQSFVVGAFFLGFSDSLSRALIPPHELPLGVLTTILGGPLFLWALWKKT